MRYSDFTLGHSDPPTNKDDIIDHINDNKLKNY